TTTNPQLVTAGHDARRGFGTRQGRRDLINKNCETRGVEHHMILAGPCGAADFVLPERRTHERIRTTLGGPRPWEGPWPRPPTDRYTPSPGCISAATRCRLSAPCDSSLSA